MVRQKREKQPKRIPASREAEVKERSGGMCEGCGEHPGINIHHRQYLSRGGTHNLSNLMHLCGAGNTSGCHGKAHNGGEQRGWSVWSWARPEIWPVLYRGQWVQLFDAKDGDQWYRKITETIADMLMNGGRPGEDSEHET